MHHRIMVRSERESKNEIATFRALKPQIPAISNASESGKQNPAQSLRALFTDDVLGKSVAQPSCDRYAAASGSQHPVRSRIGCNAARSWASRAANLPRSC